MNIVDFFRFPISEPSEDCLFDITTSSMSDELNMMSRSVVQHSAVALFDSNIVNKEDELTFIREKSQSGQFSFFFMPNLNKSIESQIKLLKRAGCKAIVFHPYLQKITKNDLQKVQEFSKAAEENDMFVCICAAYGSKDIYNYFPLECVVSVASVVECPVVIIHGGGAKIMDAFLIADAFPHVILDTSFSLNYWLNTPVEEWFAVAMRRLGADRWMFGSDAPFVNLEVAIDRHVEFFSRHNFTKEEIDKIMGENAMKILKV